MEIRQKEILLKSDKLFRKHGFKQVTMDDIAREMGMSKKTVYKYFDNKKDLISNNIKFHIDYQKNQLCALADESENAILEMTHLIRHVIIMFEELDPDVFNELKHFYPESWLLMDGFLGKHIYQRVFNNMERGKKEGLYRKDIDSDILAKMYVAKVRGIMEEELFPKIKYSKQALLRALIEYHIRGIVSNTGLNKFENYKNELL